MLEWFKAQRQKYRLRQQRQNLSGRLLELEAAAMAEGTWDLSANTLIRLSELAHTPLMLRYHYTKGQRISVTVYDDCVEDLVQLLKTGLECMQFGEDWPVLPAPEPRLVWVDDYLVDRQGRVVKPIQAVRTLHRYLAKCPRVMAGLPDVKKGYYERRMSRVLLQVYTLMEALLKVALLNDE